MAPYRFYISSSPTLRYLGLFLGGFWRVLWSTFWRFLGRYFGTFLGGFGFQNETVFKYVKQLSGGEKARLALALMIITPSNFLLLDEPTNHLDLESKENLELAIKNYKGSLLIISHDRYFISKVANKIIEIKDSKLISYNGNYEYFLEKNKV